MEAGCTTILFANRNIDYNEGHTFRKMALFIDDICSVGDICTRYYYVLNSRIKFENYPLFRIHLAIAKRTIISHGHVLL